jgi:peptidoglycan-N-acetylglucosamine deacetylase
MKQKWMIGVLFITSIFIFTAYFIGLNQGASQLELANEKVAMLEKQIKKYSTNEIRKQDQITADEKQQSFESHEKIQQLHEKIKQLEKELHKLEANKKQEKKVFLTFDDGPSSLTNEILAILNKKDVKATFFTIGNLMEQHPEIVKQTYKSGHMVLPHSYSHKYSIYTTFDTFYKDFAKVEDAYESILGIEAPPVFRFPGGSSNQTSTKYGGKQFMPQITADLRERGYSYVDWNVISGDASPISKNPKAMLEQVINGSENNDFVVALFHDITPNKATAKILPDVIDFYQKNGYTFRTFRDVTEDEMAEMVKRGIVNKTIYSKTTS